MKKRNSLYKYFFIIIIILSGVFICGNKIESYQQKKVMMDRYINTMVGEINFCKNTLYQLDDWSVNVDENNIPVKYNSFIQSIKFIEDFNTYTFGYMSRYKNSYIFSRISESFKTIDIIVNLGWDTESGFLSDGVISDNEKLFLTNLYNDLLDLEGKLYDYEENKEKDIISLKEYSNIMNNFTEKYSFNNIENIFTKN